MEQNRLTIKGMSHIIPPEFSEDGECSRIMNLRSKNGIWETTGLPEEIYKIKDTNREIIAIHSNEGYVHYISYDGNSLWFEAEEKDGVIVETNLLLCQQADIRKVEPIGNTLTVIAADKISYLLFKDGEYRWFDGLPELPEIIFYMNEKRTETEYCQGYTLVNQIQSSEGHIVSETDRTNLSQYYYGTYSICRTRLKKEGYFAHPFMIRYAIRLYDGSYILPSPPIPLAPPQSIYQMNDIQCICNVDGNDNVSTIQGNNVSISGYRLYYRIESFDLAAWKDIISSIDVFISDEIPIVKQEGFGSEKDKGYHYEIQNIGGKNTRVLCFDLPQLTNDEIKERILNEEVFYHIATFSDLENMKPDSSGQVPFQCDYENITQQKRLIPDNTSHHSLSASVSYAYNQRLHLGDVYTRLFSGFRPVQFSTAQLEYNGIKTESYIFTGGYVKVYLHGLEGDSEVFCTIPRLTPVKSLVPFISYPDQRAYKMEINCTDRETGHSIRKTFDLKSSTHHNLAYYYSEGLVPINLDIENLDSGTPEPETQEKNVIWEVPNKLIVSKTYNPFVFPEEQTYTLSNGGITGIVSSTAALSQGQYGEFPLYIFTTEGIWALQTGNNGIVYSGQHPVNREVALSPDAIIPVDNAIVYISQQGIMLLQGSESQLLYPVFQEISDRLPDNDYLFLPDEVQDVVENNIGTGDFLKKCTGGYLYPRQEIIFSHPDYDFVYVFMLNERSFYRRNLQVSYLRSFYPDLLAGSKEGEIYNLCNETEGNQQIALITRAIKLVPDIYSRWRQIFIRGDFEDTDLSVSLWGSNQANGRYYCLNHSIVNHKAPNGIPLKMLSPAYKFHRLAITGETRKPLHIDAIDIQYETILANKLR